MSHFNSILIVGCGNMGGAMLAAGAIWGIVDLAEVARVDRERARTVRLELGIGSFNLAGDL